MTGPVIAFLLTLAAAGRASAAGQDTSPAPALHLKPAAVLSSGAQILHFQAVLERNYPLLETALAWGLGGGIECAAQGLFDHQKTECAGSTRRYDSDEMQAGLRWGTQSGRNAGSNYSAGAGWTRWYARCMSSDGGYSFSARRYLWAETSSSMEDNGSRVIVALKGLRDQDAGNDTLAAAASLELAPVIGLIPSGDFAVFLKNPGHRRRPWAAGVRVPFGQCHLVCYVSNTRGTAAPDSLSGLTATHFNVRVHLAF